MGVTGGSAGLHGIERPWFDVWWTWTFSKTDDNLNVYINDHLIKSVSKESAGWGDADWETFGTENGGIYFAHSGHEMSKLYRVVPKE